MTNSNDKVSRKRHKKIMLWSFAAILAGAMVLPLLGYVLVMVDPAFAATDYNPRAEYWRAVRGGNEGYTAVVGQETNVLIQNGGQNWRQLRNGPVASYLPWALAISFLALGLFYIKRGQIRLEHGARSGERVERWTVMERTLHWFTAVLFILLSISGLSLLFGRAVLIPVLGPEGFAAYAQFSITIHNYLGPFFVVGILLEIVSWIKHNIPNATDVEWFKKGGGMLAGKAHPSAGRMNAGEKAWFWLLATVGVAVCVTGLILDFPNFQQTRETMQISNLIHGILAVIWIAVALGHIYIGTIGTEGALEGMTTGSVSAEWAKQHHDQWYEEMKREGKTSSSTSGASDEGGGYTQRT